jgi:hypothetical protein
MARPFWLRRLFVRKPPAPARRQTRRLTLEALEDRLVPSTFTVMNTSDSGAGSLRQAILDANAAAGPDVINFDPAAFGTPSTIGLLNSLPDITDDLTINGPTAARLTISGDENVRILSVSAGDVTLSDLTLTNGVARGADGADAGFTGDGGDGGAGEGGAIFIGGGTVTLNNSTLANNVAQGGSGGNGFTGGGGDGGAGEGGAIYVAAGSVTLNNSTLANNAAQGGSAGIGSPLGRMAEGGDGLGGAISVNGGASATLLNSTLSGNIVVAGQNFGIFLTGPSAQGGGLYSNGTVTLTNSIVGGNTLADGTTPSDLAGGADVSAASSHNLIGPGGAGGLADGVNGNIVVASAAALGLGALGDHGGPTQTVSLLTGSPAIDAADPSLAPATDQRGLGRVGLPDIGAFEVQKFTVTNTNDSGDGSLRQAILYANAAAGADVINFDPAAFSTPSTIRLLSSLPDITGDLTINGPTAVRLTISGDANNDGVNDDGDVQILSVSAGDVTLSDLTLTGGRARGADGPDGGVGQFPGDGGAGEGGALYVDGGAVTLSNSTLADNAAQGGPGGGGFGLVAGTGGTGEGGAIYVAAGSVTLNNSTLADNAAQGGRGGSPAMGIGGDGGAGEGGAIYVAAGAVTLNNSTLADNAAQGGPGGSGSITPFGQAPSGADGAGQGGAIYVNGGAGATLLNSTLSGNTVSGQGGGLYSDGTVTLNNSIVGGNTLSDGTTPSDIDGGGDVTAASSHNLIGPGGSGGLADGVNGNIVVASSAALGLGALGDHGGPTQTVSLLSSSPAIDAADPSLAPATDQRGLPRDALPDIGAFEAQKPSLTLSLTAVTVNEGSPATNTGTFDDLLGRATVTLTASLGTITRDDSTGTWSWSYTPADGPSGPTTVTLTATNSNGLTATVTFTLTVNNVAPTAGVSGPSDGVRGQVRTFTLTANDPSSVDQAAGFTFAIAWGDGTTQTVSGPSGTTVSHVYTASGTYTVQVTATDKDGGTSAAATQKDTITAVALETDPTDPSKTALFVGGTTGADTIVIKPTDANGTLNVKIGATSLGNFKPSGHIIVYGQAGDDTIKLQTASINGKTVYVTAPAFLFGDDGNDTLDASGSSANNVLEGGAGNDTLKAGRGRNLLIGGTGADVLQGNSGDDILIGGTTDYDSNLAALNAIMAEWGRTDANYQTRVNHLNGTLGGGLNGGLLLTANTVHDDAASDQLSGGAGMDWFFARLSGTNKDVIKDWANEVVTGL